MPLQDLTPQLRTRLNQMERAVGWFVFLASALLVFGFGYYIYHTAERKGWFKTKAQFVTYVQSSAGLKVGDPIFLMGFQVGDITLVHPRPPGDARHVEVRFEVLEPYFRYIWSRGSFVKVNSGFLGQSQLEITRGTNGYALCVTQPIYCKTIPELEQLVAAQPGQWQLSQFVYDAQSNVVFKPYQPYDGLAQSNLELMASLNLPSNSVFAYNNKPDAKTIVAVWSEALRRYDFYDHKKSQPVELPAMESVPVADRLDKIIGQVETALPNILSITNKLFAVLDNAANATSNLNATIVNAQPLVTNFASISGQLREPGGLTLWALGTNSHFQLESALTNANSLLVSADTNLNQLTLEIGATLENLASITSNLNVQVHSNSNMLGGISKTVMDADDMIQGLKRHWLLRSAFKNKTTNAPATPLKSPRDTIN
jgi:ABC-type transporter Mla subunit MlaD